MNKLLSTLIILAFAALTVQPAHAYLDPGTGSMVVQVLIATFATVLVFFKSIWQTLKTATGLKSKKINEINDDD